MKKIILLVLLASMNAHALTKVEEKACDDKYNALVAQTDRNIHNIKLGLQEAAATSDWQEAAELRKDLAKQEERKANLEGLSESAHDKEEFCALLGDF